MTFRSVEKSDSHGYFDVKYFIVQLRVLPSAWQLISGRTCLPETSVARLDGFDYCPLRALGSPAMCPSA